MKTLLAIFAALILASTPAMAETANAPQSNDNTIIEETLSVESNDDDPEATEAVESAEEGAPAQDEVEAPAADNAAEESTDAEVTQAEAAPSVDVDAATQTCTDETNEKVKLPEGASDAEQAQWDAALAECLKGKGVSAE